MTMQLEDVFKLSGVPEVTFVEPIEFPRLVVALRTKGRGVVIEGPSGIGKTSAVSKALLKLDADSASTTLELTARKKDDRDLIAELPSMHDAGLVVIDDFHRLPPEVRGEIADFLKVLADEEKVVEHLHPHWITLVPATFWFLVICAGVGLGVGYAPGSHPWHLVVIVAVLVVGAVLLVWRSLAPWVRWRTTHYVFTTHRVLIRRGVLRRTGRDIALQRISDVAFAQSLWERMVKAGSVTIESAGEQGQEVLSDMPNSERQQQLLNRLIEQDSARRARDAAQGQYSPPPGGTLPPGYPTQQFPEGYQPPQT